MSRRETRSSAGLGAGTDFLIIDKPLAQVSKQIAKYKGLPIRWAAARMGVRAVAHRHPMPFWLLPRYAPHGIQL